MHRCGRQTFSAMPRSHAPAYIVNSATGCQHAECSRVHLHLCGSRHLPAAAGLQVGTIQQTAICLLAAPFPAAGAQHDLTACRLGAAVHFWALPVHTVCKGPLVNEITRMPLSQKDYILIVDRMPEFERQLIQLQVDVREQPCYLEDPAEPVLLAYARQYDVVVSLCGEVCFLQIATSVLGADVVLDCAHPAVQAVCYNNGRPQAGRETQPVSQCPHPCLLQSIMLAKLASDGSTLRRAVLSVNAREQRLELHDPAPAGRVLRTHAQPMPDLLSALAAFRGNKVPRSPDKRYRRNAVHPDGESRAAIWSGSRL